MYLEKPSNSLTSIPTISLVVQEAVANSEEFTDLKFLFVTF
jgi:hypothetical protein